MKYVVRSPLLHDGIDCRVDDTVPGSYFRGEQIAHLTACGTLVPLADAETTASVPHPDETGGGVSDAAAPALSPVPAPAPAKRKAR